MRASKKKEGKRDINHSSEQRVNNKVSIANRIIGITIKIIHKH